MPPELDRLSDRDLLMRIVTLLESYNKHLQDLTVKLVMAILALAGASVGLKFVASPAPFVLATYVSLIGGMFLLGTTAALWRKLYWAARLNRVSFGLFMLFSAIVRIFVFEPGVEAAPTWYMPIIDGFFIFLGVSLIITVWRNWDHSRTLR